MFDGLDLEIPSDFDLLFRRIENWICCVIPANEEPVLATNTNLSYHCSSLYHHLGQGFSIICLAALQIYLTTQHARDHVSA